jgi:hypothetical protein
MSKSHVVRLLILMLLVMCLSFAGSARQAQVKAEAASMECKPRVCPEYFHWDRIQCDCVCNLPCP